MYKFFSFLIICGCSLQQAFAATPDINKVGGPKFPLKEGQIQIYLFKKTQLFAGKDWRYFVHDQTFDQADNKHYTVANVSSGKVLFGLKRGGYLATEPLYLDPKFIGKAIFIQIEDGSHRKLKYEFIDPQTAQLELKNRYVVGRNSKNNILTIKNLAIRNPPWKSMDSIEIEGYGNSNGMLDGKGRINIGLSTIVEGDFIDGVIKGEATVYLSKTTIFKGRLTEDFTPVKGTLYNTKENTSFTGKLNGKLTGYWEKSGAGICVNQNGEKLDCYYIHGRDFTEDKKLESIYPLRKEVHAFLEEMGNFNNISDKDQEACSKAVRKLQLKNSWTHLHEDTHAARSAYDDAADDFEEREQDLKQLKGQLDRLVQKMQQSPQYIDEKGFDLLFSTYADYEKAFYIGLNQCLRSGDRALKKINQTEARKKQLERENAALKAKIWAPENFKTFTNKDDPALRMLKQHQQAIQQAQEFNRKTRLTSSNITLSNKSTTKLDNKAEEKNHSEKLSLSSTNRKSTMDEKAQKNKSNQINSTKSTKQLMLTLKKSDEAPPVKMIDLYEAYVVCYTHDRGSDWDGYVNNGRSNRVKSDLPRITYQCRGTAGKHETSIEAALKECGAKSKGVVLNLLSSPVYPNAKRTLHFCGFGGTSIYSHTPGEIDSQTFKRAARIYSCPVGFKGHCVDLKNNSY
ncbi:hypothetical protein AYK86_10940 [Acinetobacter venetianus]|uniref:hypothetical protein n=1 Tax=Acinetobacter venetianus TaxID=52133 RepID=UPI000775633F|nr:hypothetical protein [Acinetobacter venetianus]KXO80542.1 hypothetical protein AYK86_10940 [Acinetobacter venetianus]